MPMSQEQENKKLMSLSHFIQNMEDFSWKVDPSQVVVGKKLGGGTYGDVYSCHFNDELCAIKEIPITESMTSSEFERIVVEMDILSKVRSQFIVYFYGAYFDDKVNIVTELMETDLSKKINDIKEDDWDLNKMISRKIIYGIRDLHRKKIIHSDLKPSNILISNDFSEVKIADFGLSVVCSYSCSKTFQQNLGGTCHYMAPEQSEEGKLCFNSDIYSFGCILYELCLNEKPWRQLNFKQILRKFFNRETPRVEKNIPDFFKNLIEKCLEYYPENRPSAKDLSNELNDTDNSNIKNFHINIKTEPEMTIKDQKQDNPSVSKISNLTGGSSSDDNRFIGFDTTKDNKQLTKTEDIKTTENNSLNEMNLKICRRCGEKFTKENNSPCRYHDGDPRPPEPWDFDFLRWSCCLNESYFDPYNGSPDHRNGCKNEKYHDSQSNCNVM